MQDSIHVCILTTAHPIGDVRVKYKFAQAFLDANYRVSWVGPGHTFSDYKYEQGRIEYTLSSPIMSRLDRILSPGRIRQLAEKIREVDIYYAPEPDSAKIAIDLARKNGAKVIFDIHEIYHGAILNRWMMGFHLNPLRNFIRRRISNIASQCDLVIGVSNSVLKQYIKDNTTGLVVRSCAPSWFANEEPADVCGPNRTCFRVMHGKGILGRGTQQVVEAAAIAASQIQNLQIVMFDFGSSSQNLKDDTINRKIKKLGLKNTIEFLQAIPMKEMPNVLKTCDAGMIAYGRELGVDSLPNRLFEYMAAGIAVIAPIYAKEIAGIVEIERCGVLVDFEDPENISEAIINLAKNPQNCRDMGRRAREAFLARHNWNTEVNYVFEQIKKWKIT